MKRYCLYKFDGYKTELKEGIEQTERQALRKMVKGET